MLQNRLVHMWCKERANENYKAYRKNRKYITWLHDNTRGKVPVVEKFVILSALNGVCQICEPSLLIDLKLLMTNSSMWLYECFEMVKKDSVGNFFRFTLVSQALEPRRKFPKEWGGRGSILLKSCLFPGLSFGVSQCQNHWNSNLNPMFSGVSRKIQTLSTVLGSRKNLPLPMKSAATEKKQRPSFLYSIVKDITWNFDLGFLNGIRYLHEKEILEWFPMFLMQRI